MSYYNSPEYWEKYEAAQKAAARARNYHKSVMQYGPRIKKPKKTFNQLFRESDGNKIPDSTIRNDHKSVMQYGPRIKKPKKTFNQLFREEDKKSEILTDKQKEKLAKAIQSAKIRGGTRHAQIELGLPPSGNYTDELIDQVKDVVVKSESDNPFAKDISFNLDSYRPKPTTYTPPADIPNSDLPQPVAPVDDEEDKPWLFKHDKNKGISGALKITLGVLLIVAAVLVVVGTAGAAAPILYAAGLGASAMIAGGAGLAVKGGADMAEGISGKNPVRDKLFGGNEEKYQDFENTAVNYSKAGIVIASGAMAIKAILKRMAEKLAAEIAKGSAEIIATQSDKILNEVAKSGKSNAFEIAKQGGRHSNTYQIYKDKPINQIEKGINSFGKQITKHQDKLKNPSKYVENFDTFRPERQKRLLEHWRQEISDFNESIELFEGIIKERK